MAGKLSKGRNVDVPVSYLNPEEALKLIQAHIGATAVQAPPGYLSPKECAAEWKVAETTARQLLRQSAKIGLSKRIRKGSSTYYMFCKLGVTSEDTKK